MKFLLIMALGAAVLGGIYHEEIGETLAEAFDQNGYSASNGGGVGVGVGVAGSVGRMGNSVNNSMTRVGSVLNR